MCDCNNQIPSFQQTGDRLDCIYDLTTLQQWLLQLLTIKQSDQVIEVGLTYPKINSYIGYIQSAINTNNPCYFETQLNEIANTITYINGL